MVYENVVDPYLSKGLKENITNLRSLVKSTMEQVHSSYMLEGKDLTDDLFQTEVINRLKPLLSTSFFNSLDQNVGIWATAIGGTMRQYFRERMVDAINPEIYFKVAVKCNSQGGNEVLPEDVEPWLDSLADYVNDSNRKLLTSASTRKVALANLVNMIEFPVSVKETRVDRFLSEEAMDALLIDNPEKFLPEGAINLINQGKNISDFLIVTSNVAKYKKSAIKNGERSKNKTEEKNYKTELRFKSSSAIKLAKYVVGIRDMPAYDDLGGMEVVPRIEDIPKCSLDVLSLKMENMQQQQHNHEYRYPVKKGIVKPNVKITGEELKKSYSISEESIMQLLTANYLKKDGSVDENKIKHFRKNLIYGEWIDMKLKTTKGPMEIQVKDEFGALLYSFNSPFGHNSKAYSKVRKDELSEPVKVGGRTGKKYFVDRIANYVANEVLLPAFSPAGRL